MLFLAGEISIAILPDRVKNTEFLQRSVTNKVFVRSSSSNKENLCPLDKIKFEVSEREELWTVLSPVCCKPTVANTFLLEMETFQAVSGVLSVGIRTKGNS